MGSSAFVDDARWASFLAGMTSKEAKELGYNDTERRRFVRWNISKHNYSAPLNDLWFKRGEGGVLELQEHTRKKKRRWRRSGRAMRDTFVGWL